MMKYCVILQSLDSVNRDWLLANFSGPITRITDADYDIINEHLKNNKLRNKIFFIRPLISVGYTGPNWFVWRQKIGNYDIYERQWVTIGLFKNAEDAILFELSWS